MDDSEADQLLKEVEFQTAILVRNLEMLKRRSDFYQEVDRAGYLLLRTLEKTGPLTISDLSSILGLDPSTVGRQVNVVHTSGLVTKTPDPHDQRRSIVSVTEAGQQAMRAVQHRRLEGTTEILDGWSEKDLRVLTNMFTRYNHEIADRYRLGRPTLEA